jgi:hypothetical protein
MSTAGEDRNCPVRHDCPHCGNPDTLLMPPMGDFDRYRCPECKEYRLSGIYQKEIDNGRFDPKHGRFVVVDGIRHLVRCMTLRRHTAVVGPSRDKRPPTLRA